MEQSAGMDVSLDLSSACVVNAARQIVRKAKVCGPEALATFLAGLNLPLTQVSLEADPLSQWLLAGPLRVQTAVILVPNLNHRTHRQQAT
jgi:transposase